MQTRTYWTVAALLAGDKPRFCHLTVLAYNPREAVIHAQGICNDELPAGSKEVEFLAAAVFEGTQTVARPDVHQAQQYRQLLVFNPATRTAQALKFDSLEDIRDELALTLPFGLVDHRVEPVLYFHPAQRDSADSLGQRRQGIEELFPALARKLRQIDSGQE